MQKRFINMIILTIGLIIGNPLSTAYAADKATDQSTQQDVQNNKASMEEIQRFTTAINYIKTYYVRSMKDTDLFENAIRGMLNSLDPHSAYLDEEDFNDLNASTKGEFGGLGIEVIMGDDSIKVVTPIDNSPAAKAGIKPLDRIIMLDDKPIKGMSLREAVEKMRGPKGTKIRLTILREGVSKPVVLTVTRDIIHVQSVKSELFDNKYGYVRISSFQINTNTDVKRALETLRKKANGNLSGLILDLRNNPGGLLDSAIDVADDFLPRSLKDKDNIIVYTKGRIPGSQFVAYARNDDLLNGAPIVVLINEGSASGAEIVAGALQDHKRAIIMGARSFGKGSIQTVLPLDEQHALKLTTALYYTPSGRSIQAQGIEPDIKVSNIIVHKSNNLPSSFSTINEASLQRHLENKSKTTLQNNTVGDTGANLVFTDFQLYEALNLLKGLVATKQPTFVQ